MATVTQERRANWNATDRRVRHPLQTVRGYIRQYVILEGVGQTLLYLSVAFWLGVAFDWGLFRTTGVDWIQMLQDLTSDSIIDRYVRGLLLMVVVLGLVVVAVTRTVMRLFGEFSDPAMALLLERRFPRELGDRLITAVELADPLQGERYGFSVPLIEKTIRDAADRVEKVPVRGVFNWARLRTIYIFLALSTLGLYVAVGSVACLAMDRGEEAPRKTADGDNVPPRRKPITPVDFVQDFNDTAAIWVDRNLLLRDIYWPRQAFLEVIGFKASAGTRNEMRVGSGEEREQLRVRALKWIKMARTRTVIDDEGNEKSVSVQGGWAPLLVADLTGLFNDEEREKFKITLPVDWNGWILDPDDQRGDWHAWTVDQLWRQYENSKVRLKMDAVAVGGNTTLLREMFERLSQLADEAGMGRRIRELTIPTEATLNSAANGKFDRKPLLVGEENKKFDIGFSSVTYTTTFSVNALDYATPTKTIAVIPPPSLLSLTVDRLEPAYVYYRLAHGDQKPLKGVRHLSFAEPLALTDISKVKVAMGSDIVLRGEIAEVQKGKLKDITFRAVKDKDRLEGEKNEEKAAIPRAKAVLDESKSKFTVTINKIVTTHDFVMEFRDENNAVGQRRVRIDVQADAVPEAFVEIESEKQMRLPRMRGKTTKGVPALVADAYLITPDARLPLRGKLRDDIGLTDANWVARLERVDVEFFETSKAAEPAKDPKSPKDVKDPKGPPVKLAKNIVERKLPLRDIIGYDEYTGKLVNGTFRRWEKDQEGRSVTLNQINSLNEWEHDSLAMIQLFNQDKFQEAEPLAKDLLEKRRLTLGADHPDVAKSLRFLSKLREALKDEEGAKSYQGQAIEIDRKRRGVLVFWEFALLKETVNDFHVNSLHSLVSNLKAGSNQPQLHYLLSLSLEATDNNVETGPSTTESSSVVKFIVVSEAEFLAQVGEDEGPLSKRLDEAYSGLEKSRTRLQEQYQNLSSTLATYEDIRSRITLAQMEFAQSYALAKDVFREYEGIQNHLFFNRSVNEEPFQKPRGYGPVHEKYERVTKHIVNPLANIVLLDKEDFPPVDYPSTEAAIKRLYDAAMREKDAGLKGFMPSDSLAGRQQEAADCRDKVVLLMAKLNKISIEIQQVVTEAKAREVLDRLAKEQQQRADEMRRLYEKEYKDFFDSLTK